MLFAFMFYRKRAQVCHETSWRHDVTDDVGDHVIKWRNGVAPSDFLVGKAVDELVGSDQSFLAQTTLRFKFFLFVDTYIIKWRMMKPC